MTTSTVVSQQTSNYLGNLRKLPYDVRLLVWKQLRPEGQDKETERASSKSGLAIIRANSDLYHEICRPLYARLSLTFETSPAYDPKVWVTAHCDDGRAVWKFSDEFDALNRGFGSFPYHGDNVCINVNLCAPDNKDPGQLICLWNRVNRLVDFLASVQEKQGRRIHKLNVRFEHASQQPQQHHHHHRHASESMADWFENCDGNDMITKAPFNIEFCQHLPFNRAKSHSSIQASRDYYSNADIALSPFLRLRHGARSFNVTAHSAELQESLNRTLINQAKTVIVGPASVTSISNSKRVYFHLNYILDTALDFLPGPTARFMRRDRFGNWFSNGGSSNYENVFLDTNRHLPHLIGTFDPGLAAVAHRVRALLALNPMRRTWNPSSSSSRRRGRKQKRRMETLTADWNPDAWANTFPRGLPPFASFEWERGFSEIVRGSEEDDNDDYRMDNGEHIWKDYRYKDAFYLRFKDTIEGLQCGK